MESLARVVLGLVVLALLLNVVRRGPGGAVDWLRAKYLGRAPAPRGAARPAPAGAHK